MARASAKSAVCIDCIAEGVTTYRPTPHGGPRSPLCVTHNRARKRARSLRAHERHLEKDYGITSAQYWTQYAAQGGKCFVCRRARGHSKRLAVEHDHDVAREECNHDPDLACPHCWRCLACDQCNEMLGRYPVDALARAITVKVNPPAQRVLRGEKIE